MKTNAMKKKLIFLLSCLVLLFCLTACGQKDNTEALTKWYNGKDRTQIEQQINNIYEAQGLKFSITVEEPDTIVYNYQYTSSNSSINASDREALASLLGSLMDSASASVKSDIAQYQEIYKLPVKVIRMVYLDPDGDILFSKDIDENYEPSDDALAEHYSSLEEWVGSAGKDSFVSAINPSLEQVGLTIDFEADGDTLILIYRFTEQQVIPDYSQEELEASFASSLGASAESMQDNLQTMLGFKIGSMRIQIKNADGTLICDIPMSAILDAR